MFTRRFTRSAGWTAVMAVALLAFAAPGAARADGLQRLKDYLEQLDAVFDHCHYKLTIQSEYFGDPDGMNPSGVRFYEWRIQRPHLRMSQLETFYHWDGSLRSSSEWEVLVENGTVHSAGSPWPNIESYTDPKGLMGDAGLPGVPDHWELGKKLRSGVHSVLPYSHLYNFVETSSPSGDPIVEATRRKPVKGVSDIFLRVTFHAEDGRVRSIESFGPNSDFLVGRLTVDEYLELPRGAFPTRLVMETFVWGTNQLKGRHTFVADDVSLGIEAPAGTFNFPQFVKDLQGRTSPTRTVFQIANFQVTLRGGKVVSDQTSSGTYEDGVYRETYNAEEARTAERAASRQSPDFLDGAWLSMKWSLPLLGGLALVLLLLPKVFRRAPKWERE